MGRRPSHVVLRKSVVKQDWKLRPPPGERSNGRKVLVNGLYPHKEIALEQPGWEPGPPDGKTPVLETGAGGIEIATFNERAAQDRHKHLESTEIYTVLEGRMTIEIDGERLCLDAGDEVVVLPGTVHEVINTGNEYLVRVHAVQCHGDMDKYVERAGAWCAVHTLRNEA